jgi:hypothetical protein
MIAERQHTDARKHVRELWDRVCYRLDVYALVTTQCVNVAILILWLSMSA